MDSSPKRRSSSRSKPPPHNTLPTPRSSAPGISRATHMDVSASPPSAPSAALEPRNEFSNGGSHAPPAFALPAPRRRLQQRTHQPRQQRRHGDARLPDELQRRRKG